MFASQIKFNHINHFAFFSKRDSKLNHCYKVDSVLYILVFIFVFLFNFVMNGLPYVSDECRVSVLFLDRVFKVTGLGVVVSRGSGNDISRVPRFAAPVSRYGEYLKLA